MRNSLPFTLASLLCFAVLLAATPAVAQTATFTYRGRLTAAGNPANGPHDMEFKLFDTAEVGGGAQRGETKSTPAVPVANGIFTVTLDFGGAVFDGSSRFLEIGVKPGGSASPYTTLAPRQQVASIPYAIQSLNATTASTALTVASGSVVQSLNNLKDNVTLAAGPNVTITNIGNILTIGSTGGGGGGGSELWFAAANDAYYNKGNVGIGTSTPAHRLSLSGGPNWTGNGWVGSVELPNGAALGWQANAAGQRFGMGHTGGGFYLFRTASDPGTTGNPALYDFVVNDVGNVGIGTTTPSHKLDVLSDASTAIVGRSTGGIGVLGASSQFNGVRGEANNTAYAAVFGVHQTGGIGVLGQSLGGGAGVYGESAQFNGVRGVANNTAHGAVVGVHNSGGIGVLGQSDGNGVFGNSLGSGAGVYGRSATGPAVHADGNATQTRDKGGFVKAMAYIDPFLPADQYVVRCYNSQKAGSAASTAPCGITVRRSGEGFYSIDFGFRVDDRFFSIMVVNNSGVIPHIRLAASASNSVLVDMYHPLADGDYIDTAFQVIVYRLDATFSGHETAKSFGPRQMLPR